MVEVEYPECVTGGIPPDPDQSVLFTCCVEGCRVTQDQEPLVCSAANGKLATLCRDHYDLLTRRPVGWGTVRRILLLDVEGIAGMKRWALILAGYVLGAVTVTIELAPGSTTQGITGSYIANVHEWIGS